MVYCQKCGVPNPVGRTVCYKCNEPLIAVQRKWKKWNVFPSLSWAFVVVSGVNLVLVIMFTMDIMDYRGQLPVEYRELFPRRWMLWVVFGGVVQSLVWFAVGEALRWMEDVRDALGIIISQQK